MKHLNESILSKKSGLYNDGITDLDYRSKMTYDDIMGWIKSNRIKVVDIGNWSGMDLMRHIGTGVALKGRGYTQYSIILCPMRDPDHVYLFSFHVGEDEVEEAFYYTRTGGRIFGTKFTTKQLVRIINDLDRKMNFVKE